MLGEFRVSVFFANTLASILSPRRLIRWYNHQPQSCYSDWGHKRRPTYISTSFRHREDLFLQHDPFISPRRTTTFRFLVCTFISGLPVGHIVDAYVAHQAVVFLILVVLSRQSSPRDAVPCPPYGRHWLRMEVGELKVICCFSKVWAMGLTGPGSYLDTYLQAGALGWTPTLIEHDCG